MYRFALSQAVLSFHARIVIHAEDQELAEIVIHPLRHSSARARA